MTIIASATLSHLADAAGLFQVQLPIVSQFFDATQTRAICDDFDIAWARAPE